MGRCLETRGLPRKATGRPPRPCWPSVLSWRLSAPSSCLQPLRFRGYMNRGKSSVVSLPYLSLPGWVPHGSHCVSTARPESSSPPYGLSSCRRHAKAHKRLNTSPSDSLGACHQHVGPEEASSTPSTSVSALSESIRTISRLWLNVPACPTRRSSTRWWRTSFLMTGAYPHGSHAKTRSSCLSSSPDKD